MAAADYIPGAFDGIIRENTLCLDPERTRMILKKEFGIPKLSTQAINKQLLDLGLLKTDRSASNTQKVYGKRMIVILQDRLADYMKKTDGEWMD